MEHDSIGTSLDVKQDIISEIALHLTSTEI